MILGSGLLLVPVTLFWLLGYLLPENWSPPSSPYGIYTPGIFILLTLGLLLALLPPRKGREKKTE